MDKMGRLFYEESEWREFMSDPQVLADLQDSVIKKCQNHPHSSCAAYRPNYGSSYSYSNDYCSYLVQATEHNANYSNAFQLNDSFYWAGSIESTSTNSFTGDYSPNYLTLPDAYRDRTYSTCSYNNMASCSSVVSSISSSYDSEPIEETLNEILCADDEEELDLNEFDPGYLIPKSKRGRKSKDDKLLEEHGLYKYFSAFEFVAMSLKQVRMVLKDPTLTQTQKAVIQKVRRRGRNKLAARKCRHKRIVHANG